MLKLEIRDPVKLLKNRRIKAWKLVRGKFRSNLQAKFRAKKRLNIYRLEIFIYNPLVITFF